MKEFVQTPFCVMIFGQFKSHYFLPAAQESDLLFCQSGNRIKYAEDYMKASAKRKARKEGY